MNAEQAQGPEPNPTKSEPEGSATGELRRTLYERSWFSWASLLISLISVLVGVLASLAEVMGFWTPRQGIGNGGLLRVKDLAPSLAASVAIITSLLIAGQVIIVRLRSRRRLNERNRIYEVVSATRRAYRFALEESPMNPGWRPNELPR